MTGPPKKKRGPRDACNIATGNNAVCHSLDDSPSALPEQGSCQQMSVDDKPWSILRLVSKCKSSPAVFLALMELASERGSAQIRLNRDDIHAKTGLYKDTISAAMWALHEAGWIRLTTAFIPGRRWYRVTIPGLVSTGKTRSSAIPDPLPWSGKTRSRGRPNPPQNSAQATKSACSGKTRSRKNELTGKNPTKVNSRLVVKNPLNSSLQKSGGHPAPPTHANAVGVSARTRLLGVEENSDHQHLISVVDTVRALTGGKSKPMDNRKAATAK